ncbi:hypothetical protein [Methylobacterium sp. A54F]
MASYFCKIVLTGPDYEFKLRSQSERTAALQAEGMLRSLTGETRQPTTITIECRDRDVGDRLAGYLSDVARELAMA